MSTLKDHSLHNMNTAYKNIVKRTSSQHCMETDLVNEININFPTFKILQRRKSLRYIRRREEKDAREGKDKKKGVRRENPHPLPFQSQKFDALQKTNKKAKGTTLYPVLKTHISDVEFVAPGRREAA